MAPLKQLAASTTDSACMTWHCTKKATTTTVAVPQIPPLAQICGVAYTAPDGTITPKSVACTWDVGSDPTTNYVQSCIAKGNTAVVTEIYCLYTYQGGRIQINEGCYRIFPADNVAAGCKRNSDGTTLTLTTWPAKNAATDPQASGLYECPIDSRK